MPAKATTSKHDHQRQLLLIQLHPGTRDLAILALAAARDQIVGQLLDVGKTLFRALDEHQRRSGVAIGHLDRAFRFLEIARNGSVEFFKGLRLEIALGAFDRLQGLRNLGGGGGGFLGHRLDFLLVLFIGRGSRQAVQLGMRRPGRGGKIVRKFRLPDRPGDQRVDRSLVRPQRLQCISADADQNQDQEGRRELNFPGQADILDPAEHINP